MLCTSTYRWVAIALGLQTLSASNSSCTVQSGRSLYYSRCEVHVFCTNKQTNNCTQCTISYWAVSTVFESGCGSAYICSLPQQQMLRCSRATRTLTSGRPTGAPKLSSPIRMCQPHPSTQHLLMQYAYKLMYCTVHIVYVQQYHVYVVVPVSCTSPVLKCCCCAPVRCKCAHLTGRDTTGAGRSKMEHGLKLTATRIVLTREPDTYRTCTCM